MNYIKLEGGIMSIVFRTCRMLMRSDICHNQHFLEVFRKGNGLRFFSSINGENVQQQLTNKRVTKGLPGKLQRSNKFQSGYFIPGKNEKGYELWENDVLKGLQEIDAYNNMIKSIKEKQ
ncbi:MAG: hypothetical protein KR126chlam5_00904 [Candidatus Anoxychlamydiales bacterium]|nr:hypothetical protein [Candidatus Anoxychlamydiales bacterium]